MAKNRLPGPEGMRAVPEGLPEGAGRAGKESGPEGLPEGAANAGGDGPAGVANAVPEGMRAGSEGLPEGAGRAGKKSGQEGLPEGAANAGGDGPAGVANAGPEGVGSAGSEGVRAVPEGLPEGAGQEGAGQESASECAGRAGKESGPEKNFPSRVSAPDSLPEGATPAAGRTLPRHLLVLRTSAMGDVAMLPHALKALRAASPELRITVATQPLFRPFFEGLGVDFLDVEIRGRHHSLGGMWALAREARRLGVDAVADVHGVLRSRAFALSMRLHGIAVATIRKGRAEKRRFIRQGGRAAAPLRHTVLRYCDVFRRLGFRFDDPVPAARQDTTTVPAPPVPTIRQDATTASAPPVLATRQDAITPPKTSPPATGRSAASDPFGPKTGIWVGFAPFSAHRGKSYPDDLSREAVRLLSARYERVFIHGGGGAEAAFAEEMERTHANVTALWGKVRLAGEQRLIERLDCVVTMDSLVMHLAALVGTPVVSVWGATHPGLGFLGYGCDPGGVLQADLECRPCSVFGAKPCIYGDYRCLRAVTPEMILRKVSEVVG